MKTRTLLFSAAFFGIIQACQAVTCYDIRERAKPSKGKSSCSLIEHTLGIEAGSTVSVYSCAGKKYTLTMYKDSTCVGRNFF